MMKMLIMMISMMIMMMMMMMMRMMTISMLMNEEVLWLLQDSLGYLILFNLWGFQILGPAWRSNSFYGV